MSTIEEIGAGPHGFTRLRIGGASGLGRRIGGQWRAFGWWTGAEAGNDTWVENDQVPPRSGKRRPKADKVLAKLESMTDKQLGATFKHHAGLLDDGPVADFIAQRPQLAIRCIRAASDSAGFVAAQRLLVRLGAAALPEIIARLTSTDRLRNVSYYAGALAAIDPSAFPKSEVLQLASHLHSSSTLETWEVLRWEALLLGMPKAQRDGVVSEMKVHHATTPLFQMPQLGAEPAVAKRLLESVIAWDASRIKYALKEGYVGLNAVMRRIGKAVPDAMIAAVSGAKSAHIPVVVQGAATIETKPAAEACVAVIDKNGVSAALRASVRENAELQAAVRAVATKGKGKKKAFAAEVMHACDARIPEVVAADRALDDLVGTLETARGDVRQTLLDGDIEDWVHIEGLIERHGIGVLACLAREVTRLIEAGHRRCHLGRWPSDLGNLILARVGDDEPLIVHAVHEMLVAWGHDDWLRDGMIPLLADRLSARGFTKVDAVLGWYTRKLEDGADVPTYVALLELMRFGKAKLKARVADALVAAGPVIADPLGPYLGWPSYADTAAEVARRVAAPQLVDPLTAAIAAKPAKKTLEALQAALHACQGAGAQQQAADAVREAEVVQLQRPAEIAGIEAALTTHAKTRRKVPEVTAALTWHTGAALDGDATKGLWAMLTGVTQCIPDKLQLEVRDALSEPSRVAAVDAALKIQPLSGKKKEVWSLNALALLGSEAQLASVCDRVGAVSGSSHVLAEHMVTAFRERGHGRALLALEALSRMSGKRAGLAGEALLSLAKSRGIEVHTLIDLGFPTGEYDTVMLRRAQARLQSAMIVARPFDAAHFESWAAERPVVQRALQGLLVRHGATLSWLGADGRLQDEGGKPVKFGAEPIVIVHPAALSAAQLQDAIAHATREGLRPGFEQLSREIAVTTENALQRMVDDARKTKFRDLVERFQGRDYVPGEYLVDSNAVMSYVRDLGHNARIEVSHDGDYSPTRVEHLYWTSPFATDPPGLLSEIALDLRAILAPPTPSKPVESKPALDIDSEYPYAEASPSGRAKCVQCSDKIAKGEVRIVIEREMEIGGYPQRVKGYLHPKCARACAEQNGVPPDAFMAAAREHSDGDVTL